MTIELKQTINPINSKSIWWATYVDGKHVDNSSDYDYNRALALYDNVVRNKGKLVAETKVLITHEVEED